VGAHRSVSDAIDAAVRPLPRGTGIMGLLSWVVVGGLAGLLAQSLMGGDRSGCLLTVVLGVVGAFIGGFVMSLLGFGGVDGLNLWSIVVATVGALVLLAIGRVVRR
jgi:uncharacterized membrane protein YeaQ/YmgE (transglycosylase-associated protein family)